MPSDENEEIVGYSDRKSEGIKVYGSNFGFMEIPELPYTIPRVIKGRALTKVPAGSTIEKKLPNKAVMLWSSFFIMQWKRRWIASG